MGFNGRQTSLMLLVPLIAAGCGAASAENSIDVLEVKVWSMPPDGSAIPAPRAVHVTADEELYVLDDAGRVLVFSLDGKLVRQWRMPESDVGNPEGLCLLADGRLAVADTHYHRVVFFDRKGNVVGMLGEKGEGPSQFIYPVAVTTDNSGNLYVGEYGGNDRVQKFDPEGRYLLEFGGFGTGPGEFQRPSGLVWHDGRVYVVDAFNNRIQVFSDEGRLLETAAETGSSAGLHYPYDIARSPSGDLFVVEYGAGRVSRFDLEGRLLGRYGSTGTGTGQFRTPWGIAAESDRLFVADTGNRRIVELKF